MFWKEITRWFDIHTLVHVIDFVQRRDFRLVAKERIHFLHYNLTHRRLVNDDAYVLRFLVIHEPWWLEWCNVVYEIDSPLYIYGTTFICIHLFPPNYLLDTFMLVIVRRSVSLTIVADRKKLPFGTILGLMARGLRHLPTKVILTNMNLNQLHFEISYRSSCNHSSI
jgi:hypothetical protein